MVKQRRDMNPRFVGEILGCLDQVPLFMLQLHLFGELVPHLLERFLIIEVGNAQFLTAVIQVFTDAFQQNQFLLKLFFDVRFEDLEDPFGPRWVPVRGRLAGRESPPPHSPRRSRGGGA